MIITNKQLKPKKFTNKSVMTVALALLVATVTLSIISSPIAFAIEDHEITTIVILPTTGGTIDPAVGNHTYANNTALTVTATPDAGYEFLYWNVTGIMNDSGEHDDMSTNETDMGHNGPFRDVSDLDSLILTDKSITFNIDCAYVYQYQAFFTPTATATPSATSTPIQNGGLSNPTPSADQQLNASDGILPIAGIVAVVGIVAAIAAVLYMKRRK